MKKFAIRAIMITFVVTGALSLLSCNSDAASAADGNAVSAADGGAKGSRDTEVSVWVAYWDLKDSMEELAARKEKIAGISFFAAYFDEDDSLFIPGEIKEFRAAVDTDFGEEKWENYLTIVNDKILGEDSSLKDTDLLKNLFADEASVRKHIDSLIEISHGGGYDGIEIDYEAIRSDMALWNRFVGFCEKLYERTEKEELKLRIILEPGAPLEELSFPEGPEYVMMCYNLYGSGEEMGPKADDAFLRKLIEKMSVLPGKKSFALATGGYAWEAGSKGRQISEKDATELIEKNDAVVRRDKKSGAVTFRYQDENRVNHTVWYADAQTLEHWQNIILDAGDYGVMLWRIGGNFAFLPPKV